MSTILQKSDGWTADEWRTNSYAKFEELMNSSNDSIDVKFSAIHAFIEELKTDVKRRKELRRSRLIKNSRKYPRDDSHYENDFIESIIIPAFTDELKFSHSSAHVPQSKKSLPMKSTNSINMNARVDGMRSYASVI